MDESVTKILLKCWAIWMVTCYEVINREVSGLSSNFFPKDLLAVEKILIRPGPIEYSERCEAEKNICSFRCDTCQSYLIMWKRLDCLKKNVCGMNLLKSDGH